MDRRLLLTALAGWPAGRLLAQDEGPRPRHRIPAAELHEALSARFPVRFGFAGLLELQVSAPRLLLLPARNRLGASLVAQVSGAQLQRMHAGEVDVVFALRYVAADQTVRAHQLEILDLRWPGLPPETAQALQAVLPALARDAVGEIVLHRFSPRELALADTMGFEPQQITVVDDGLVISFGPKQKR
ncbi:MAG TPA: DUF1439 domain-containing protein [Ramlibacter sp.]|nr:DUF1439 domain-containing protein [Ramlibacter sp.]